MKDSPAKTAKPPVLNQVSAGGVAFRERQGTLEIAIIAMNPSGRWQLPKGLIDEGETPEQAAVREVREEAGIDTEMVEKMETIDYWFVSDWDDTPRRIHKVVHFYLLRYVSGSVDDHDHEVLESRWVTIAEALELLAFDGEKSVVIKAKEALTNA